MRSLFKRWFGHFPIRKKIILVYAPLIILSIVILGFLSSRFYSNIIISKTVQNTMDDSTLIEARINALLNDAESCANIMAIDLNGIVESYGGLKPPSATSEADDVRFSVKINESIESLSFNFSDIDSCAFVDSNGNVYAGDHSVGEDAIDRSFLSKIDSMSQSNYWFPMQKRKYLTTDADVPVLTLGKRVIDLERGDKIGDLVLNISEQSLSSTFNDIDSAWQGHYFIVDSTRTIIASTNRLEVLETVKDPVLARLLKTRANYSGIQTINGKKDLLIITSFPNMGWKLVSISALSTLTKDTTKMTNIIILVILVSIVVVFVCAALLSRYLSNPIVRLTHKVNMVRDGNLDVQFDVKSSDEIGTLAGGFNNMISRVLDLLDKVRLEQKKKREFELALLQSQIKPHFLYNSLDLIYVSCQMNDYQNAAAVTKSLADFYRGMLSKGAEIISVASEMQNAKDYLVIQKIRFSDLFDYWFEIDDDLSNCKIPKFTIQPIVENAINHGLKEKNSHGNVYITGRKAGDSFVISVKDDGVGMSAEKIDEVLNSRASENRETEKPRASFGLYCVNERIKMYFGERYGMQIESAPGAGTTIWMTFPYWYEGEDKPHA